MILLIVPPLKKAEMYGKLKDVGMILPPLGLASIAAVLEKNGFEVEILDCIALKKDLNDLTRIVEKEQPQIVGITSTTSTYLRSLQTAATVKEISNDTIVVLGGPHPSSLPMEVASHESVNLVVVGEGEYTMLDITRSTCNGGRDFSKIRGIAFRKDNKVFMTEPRPLIKDLDELPMPAWDKLEVKMYKLSPISYRKKPCISMITSRGCPFNCIFCNKSIFGRTFRYRSPEKIIEEMLFLHEKFKIKDIQFWDDVLTLNMKRIFNLCDLLIKENLDIIWNCETRVDLVSAELLKKMRRAGCYEIGYGVESGSKKILKISKKGITLEQVKKAFKWTKEAGIDVKAYFVIGLPEETKETVEKSIKLAKDLDPDLVHFSIAIPFPGTEFFQTVKKQGSLLTEDWSKYTLYSDPVCSTPELTKEDRKKLLKKAYKHFYLRPKFMLKNLKKIRNLEDAKRHYYALKTIISL